MIKQTRVRLLRAGIGTGLLGLAGVGVGVGVWRGHDEGKGLAGSSRIIYLLSSCFWRAWEKGRWWEAERRWTGKENVCGWKAVSGGRVEGFGLG